MTNGRYEIVKDEEKTACMVNLRGLSIEQVGVLARDTANRAGCCLAKEDYVAAAGHLEEAAELTEICARAQAIEEAWIESMPLDEEAA